MGNGKNILDYKKVCIQTFLAFLCRVQYSYHRPKQIIQNLFTNIKYRNKIIRQDRNMSTNIINIRQEIHMFRGYIQGWISSNCAVSRSYESLKQLTKLSHYFQLFRLPGTQVVSHTVLDCIFILCFVYYQVKTSLQFKLKAQSHCCIFISTFPSISNTTSSHPIWANVSLFRYLHQSSGVSTKHFRILQS